MNLLLYWLPISDTHWNGTEQSYFSKDKYTHSHTLVGILCAPRNVYPGHCKWQTAQAVSQSDHEHSVSPLIRPAKWTRLRIRKKKQSGILSNSLCACDENREGGREKEQRVFIRDRTEHSGILSNISRACNYPTKIIRQIYRERERERDLLAAHLLMRRRTVRYLYWKWHFINC